MRGKVKDVPIARVNQAYLGDGGAWGEDSIIR